MRRNSRQLAKTSYFTYPYIVACGLKNFRDFKSKRNVDLFVVLSALRLGLRCLRSGEKRFVKHLLGELLLGLRYLRNEWNAPRLSVKVNYYLDYGASETSTSLQLPAGRVNYYLDYRTFETNGEVRTILQVVNYCLIYRTSETPRLKVKKRKQGELLPGLRYIRNLIPISREILSVNYCLIYGTSETSSTTPSPSPLVNYYLDYRTSETGRHPERLGLLVNYCLDYRTSETSSLALAARRR